MFHWGSAAPETWLRGGGDCKPLRLTFRPGNGHKLTLRKSLMSGASSEFFSGRGHQLSTIFSKVLFSGRINLKQIEKQERHDPQKIFEILYSVMAVLIFSEQFLGNFVYKFCP